MNFFDGIPFISFLILTTFLVGRIFALQKKGVQVSRKTGETQKSTRFLFPIFGLIFLIWLFEITKPAFHLSFSLLPEMISNELFKNIFLKITGTAIILLSLVLWIITLLHFKTSLRFGLDESNRGKLITTGIFSFSRNPFFLSLDLYFAGAALIFPTPFFIGFAVLAMASIHLFILKEEKFLRKVYAEEYRKYAEKVRRYFWKLILI